MGRADRPKNILKTDDCSLKVIPFKQDASYYARKGAYYNQKNRLAKALLYMQKAVEVGPDDPAHHYSLACLLSRINHLSDANTIFDHIVKNLDPELTECYFYMAVNCGLMEDLAGARKYLLRYLHYAPDGEMAEEAEDLLLALEDEDEFDAYNRNISAVESDALLKLVESLNAVQFKARLLADHQFQDTLQWGLYQGGDLLKEAIIRLYGEANCAVSRESLAQFAASPWVNERLRHVALQELKRSDPNGRYRVYQKGQFQVLSLNEIKTPAPLWEEKWQQVLECAFANMRRSAFYGDDFYQDVEAMWHDYINQIYPEGPKVGDPRTWAAGLEYSLIRYHYLGLTQKEIASAYGISAGSVQRRFSALNQVLDVDRRAHREVLALLAYDDDELPEE